MATNLLDATMAMVAESRPRISISALASRSGVGERWLRKFLSGAIPDPSVRRVQRVHDALLEIRRENEKDEAA